MRCPPHFTLAWPDRARTFAAIVLLWSGLALLGANRSARADEPSPPQPESAQLEVEHRLSMEFETPHTPWAKPYVLGKTRVLFFSGQFQSCTLTREIIEWMQRFDLDAQAVYYRTASKRLLGDGDPRWYGDPLAGTIRARRLLGETYDVFFFNHVRPADLPEPIQVALREAVLAGAGLVVVGSKEPVAFADDVRRDTPHPPTIPAGDCFTVGSGRMVVLPAREKLVYDVGWEIQLDYQMAQQGRALLWAAHKSPKGELKINLENTSVAHADVPDRKPTLHWNKVAPDTKWKARLRRSDGWTTSLGAGSCANATGDASVSLPPLRAGAYHLDVFLAGPRGIETWATSPFKVTADRNVEAIELDRSWGAPGDRITGIIHLAGNVKPTDRLTLVLIDFHDRVLVRQALGKATSPKMNFELRVEAWFPKLLRVEAVIEAVVEEGDRDISSAHTLFRVTNRRRGEFHFIVWNYPAGDLAPFGIESMARHGATGILQGGNPPRFLAERDMTYIPYTTSISPDSHSVTGMLDENGTLKGGCFNDAAAMRKRVDETADRYVEARGHGVLAYSLGDENTVHASCLSKYCLAAYRRYLKEVYNDIDALNQSWDTDLAAFDQVTLSEPQTQLPDTAPAWFKTYYDEVLEKHRTDSHKLTEQQITMGLRNDEIHALATGNLARWYDRQAFQTYNVVQLCKKFKERFKVMDPQALTGFEGTDSFSIRRHTTRTRQGGDVDLFVRELDYFGPYPGPGNELLRSIAPANFPAGNWIGYARDAQTLLQKYWSQITNGLNTIQWWRWDCLEEYHGFLAPDLSPYPATQELLADTQIVRDGLGTLLMKSEMHDDDVAMFYSLPSTYIAHLDNNPAFGHYKRDHQRWHDLIHGAGLQFRYVTDRMLRLGEFDAARYKVLILSLALAIGEKEAQVIRRFVHDGGTVIADLRPGTYTGHCKRLAAGQLDDLFGIERSGRDSPVDIDRMFVDGQLSAQKVGMRWGNWYGKEIDPRMKVDAAIKATRGKALGTGYYYHYWTAGAPVCIVNEHGQGRAILLNFSVQNAPADSLLQDMLTSAGVTPQIQIQTSEAAPARDVEVTRWSNGSIELLSLFGPHDGPIRVTLPAEKWVYDLKHHRVDRKTKTFDTTMRPYRAQFFALMSHPASDVQLTLDPSPVHRGSLARAKISIPSAQGLHALQLHLTRPDKTPTQWGQKVILVGQTPVEIEFPFAFNDAAGTWTLTATDLYTDQSTTARFDLD